MRWLLLGVLCGSFACGDDDGASDAGMDASRDASIDVGGEDTSVDVMPDTGPDSNVDAPDLRRELLDALGTSVWSGLQTRTEDVALVERAYELRFAAGSLEWAEIRNPFGPNRLRTLRSFSVQGDGRTVDSIILSPAGWPPHPRNGARESWTIEIADGDPRVLTLTHGDTGATETFIEEPWPAPTSGLTAELRVFGPSGSVWDSFCGAGPSLDDNERRIMWGYARGEGTAAVLGSDVVAGAQLMEWDDSSDGANDFAVTDIHGFDQLGGTRLSDQFNFVVRYTGTIEHPGGRFVIREDDDRVEDVVWVFLEDKVGSSLVTDLTLEVHNWANFDATDNPVEVLPVPTAGSIPIEIMAVRCAMAFAGKPLRVEINIADGGFMLVGDQPSTPAINDDLFPPAL